MASAFRTVFAPAVLVIAGVIPIDLLARERRAIYFRRAEVGKAIASREEKHRTLEEWQRTWDEDTRGHWTAVLVRRVKPRIERRHGEIGYYLTQLLSGHGYFRTYLHKIGKALSPDCLYCPGTEDTAEHIFFSCSRWEMMRWE